MTTKLGNFKLGPAKTRDGRDAEILKIVPDNPEPLIGMCTNGCGDEWEASSWDSKGFWDVADNHPRNLVPNAEPERVEFEGTVGTVQYGRGVLEHPELIRFWHRRCKVTVEVLDE